MRNAFLQLHAAVFLAGFTGVLGRLIELNEGWLVWYRMLLSAVLLLLLMLLRKQSIRIEKKYLLRCIGIGALIALHWVFFYGSVKYANVSIALVCFAATGSFTAFLEPLILKRRIDLTEVLLGLLVLLGIYLIFHFDVQYKTGILLGVAAAFLSALFPIYNKRLIQHVPVSALTLYELSGGWLLLSLVLPFYLQFSPATKHLPSLNDWFWLLMLALFCTVLAVQLSVNALKKISPFTANLTYNLEPVYGIALAFLIYHEEKELGDGFVWGILLIVASVVIQTVRVWRERRVTK
ncbi:EamA domain-containing membrane protein RarD [Lacibacter cauensis]|uniref:EamA domain-containing membrane protein RarD n=1 Tax=Lacibacter cauensis TaxID=510947 RepID=A0A562SW70_9BACT|nr:DMT family transporter [Lacibacter cauensis]TWI85278.1 EamA domain-containing membrane protein RarD [Lacibacter cauensis]